MSVNALANRVAPGGAATISLGSDSLSETLAERDMQRKATFVTPVATARFPQAPGGTSSVCLGGDVPMKAQVSRAPVGGATGISLGEASSAEDFAERQRDRQVPTSTPEAPARFPQAPGGTATLQLGGGGAEASEATASSVRGPVGGPTSISLGNAASSERFAATQASFETPDARPRFPQPPGGAASVLLSGGVPAEIARRGPVGGADTMVLSDAAPAAEAHIARGPVGGADSVVLGTHDASEVYAARRQAAQAMLASPTPDAAERFPQAPGGTSTLRLGSDGQDVLPHVVRRPVGGTDSLVLSDEVPAESLSMVMTSSRPIGGADSVILGDEAASKAVFEARRAERQAVMATPDATVRFPQAPGGTASVCLGGGEVQHAVPRGSAGGTSTLVLGGEDSRRDFDERRREREAVAATPEAQARFPQAPGGTSTVSFSEDSEPLAAVAPRGPVGGSSSVVLGSDDSKAVFEDFKQLRSAGFETPNAAPRFSQAPGGTSSVVLGGAAPAAAASPPRDPVGGRSTLVLGEDGAGRAEACRQYQEEHVHVVATPDAAPRFPQVPGGTSTLDLSSSSPLNESKASVRGPVGGADDVVLGADNSKQDFAERAATRSAPVSTPEPVRRFPQAPGGTATVVLGGSQLPAMPFGSPNRQPPGGNSSFGAALGGDYPHELMERVSSNAFATNSSQNSGNVLTERSTTRVLQMPGGNSTLVLGDEQPRRAQVAVSSNAFACGNSQNCGNVMTERSSTRLHQAPGGDSTLVLGGGYPSDINEARAKEGATAKGPSERVARRLLQSPGGNSTLSLGEDEPSTAARTRPCTRSLQAPGGTSTLCLGTELPAADKVGDENVNTSNTAKDVDAKDLGESIKEGSAAAAAAQSPAPLVVG